MKNFKQQTKFFQGLALGLVITSAISYAAVSLQTFTAGSPISSAEVNANFAEIKAKLDSLDIGYIGKMTTDQMITCGAGGTTSFTNLDLTSDYSDGHFINGIYTIPETGIYKIFLNAVSEDNMGYSTQLDISTDEGVNWEGTYISYSNTQFVRKFAEGDKIKLSAGCAGNYAGTDSTIVHTSFIYAIKKF
ncbi:MAG: hypothetical protein KBD76_02000 [Bacteriovorax sp.]|jgi:hypothetical protein|nr:hypothetical protein [Bacteriovorax sp.]